MNQVARLARIIAGFGLLALGLIGIFLPVVPQILFFVAGLLLLAREFHWARRLLDWVQRKRGQPQGSSAGPPSP